MQQSAFLRVRLALVAGISVSSVGSSAPSREGLCSARGPVSPSGSVGSCLSGHRRGISGSMLQDQPITRLTFVPFFLELECGHHADYHSPETDTSRAALSRRHRKVQKDRRELGCERGRNERKQWVKAAERAVDYMEDATRKEIRDETRIELRRTL